MPMWKGILLFIRDGYLYDSLRMERTKED
jgi:hypothetical protein